MVLRKCLMFCLAVLEVFCTNMRDTENDVINENELKYYDMQSDVVAEDDNEKLYDEAGYHRYIPEQTTFDTVDDVPTSAVLSTSPPQLTISPSSVKKNMFQTTISDNDPTTEFSLCHPTLHVTCISETPTLDFEASQLLKPSPLSKQEVLVTAGREEVPSRTDTLNNVFQPLNLVSQPSTRLILNT